MPTRYLLLLLAPLLLLSCKTRTGSDLPGMASLTVVVCENSDICQEAFPLDLYARTEDGTTLRKATVTETGQSATFNLTTWMRYQILVRDRHEHFASVLVTLCDQPTTLLLAISDHSNSSGSHNDTIYIDLDDPITDADTGTYCWPTPCSMYDNKHVIAFVDSLSPDSALLTLLSFYEWHGLTSAENATSPFDTTMVTNYREIDLGGWRIPTSDEAKRLRATFGSETEAFPLLQHLLDSVGALPITLQTGNDNARYLCDEGHKTFSFVSGTTTAKAGSKATNYRLRLVRTIRICITNK